jgi:hypothetical protein
MARLLARVDNCHRSAAVLPGYIRETELLDADNVSGRVGP